jgi:protease-4
MNDQNTQQITDNTYRYVPVMTSHEDHTTPKRRLPRHIGVLSCSVLFFLSVMACIASVLIFAAGASGFGLNKSPGWKDRGSYYQNVYIREQLVYSFEGSRSIFEGSVGSVDKIAVINIDEVISYTTKPDITILSNYTIAAQLHKAQEDPYVKAIILRFNTPGGAVGAAEPLCRQIKAIDQNKPIIAFIDNLGASLGYLLANCTRSIYSRPDALTGSMGVVYAAIDYTGILTNLGAKYYVVTNSSGTQKTGGDLTNPDSAAYKRLQSILDETFDYFFQTVLSGRKRAGSFITESDLRKYADGSVFSGKQAAQIGLVDHLAEYEDVLNTVRDTYIDTEAVDVVEYQIDPDLFTLLFGSTSKFIGELPNLIMQPKRSEVMFIMQE